MFLSLKTIAAIWKIKGDGQCQKPKGDKKK